MTQMEWLLETVRWRDGALRILDQRALPEAESYLELREIADVIEAIRSLAVRGAPAIGVAGAYGLALGAAANEQQLRAVADRLIAARPTAVNLRWAVERTLLATLAASRAPADWPEAARAEADRILEEDLGLSEAMTRHGSALLPARGRVLTHCNTGGLATGGGGTALGVVLRAAREGKDLFVHVDETRPLLQGARLTAWELRRAGVPHAINCDGAAAWILKTEEVSAVLVGADRIARNGDTANKIGTLAVALAARAFHVPFYVVAPRSSFDLSISSGDEIPIEEREPGEVVDLGRGTGSPARNPAFDVTPAELVAGWVTERGVERPPFAP